MMVSLATDILSLLTLHVYWFYVGAARIYHWQLVILRSLFNLFRGAQVCGDSGLATMTRYLSHNVMDSRQEA